MMMMKIIKNILTYISVATVIFILAGCSKDEIGSKDFPGSGTPLSFNALVYSGSGTKANTADDNAWQGGEEIQVVIGGVTKAYVAAVGGAMTVKSGTEPFTWSGASDKKTIDAYYPAKIPALIDDQSTEDKFKACDVLVADQLVDATYSASTALSFHHKMAMVEVDLTPAKGEDLSGAEVYVYACADVYYTAGVVSIPTGSPVTAIKMWSAGNNKFKAMVPPQSLTNAGSIYLVAKVAGKTYSYKPTENVTLSGGKKYIYTFPTIDGNIYYDKDFSDNGAEEAPISNIGEAAIASSSHFNDQTYYIKTAGNLKWLVNHPTAMNNYELEFNVILVGKNFWKPIGAITDIDNTTNDEFKGVFDGKNKTVYGLDYYNGDGNKFIGFFGKSVYTIKNLNVVGNIVCKGGSNHVAGIVTVATGHIINCTFSGAIKADDAVGGICATAYDCDISECNNNASISASEMGVGGIVGEAYATASTTPTYIENCNNNGTMYGTSGGGIVGMLAPDCVVANCKNTADMNSTGSVAGIAQTNSGVIIGCYNTGKIECGRSSYAGGIANANGGTIVACYNLGMVTGNGSYTWTGGICGRNDGLILCSYSAANIIGPSPAYVGGIAGATYGRDSDTDDGTIKNNLFVQTGSVVLNGIGTIAASASSIAPQFTGITAALLNSDSVTQGYVYLNNGIKSWNAGNYNDSGTDRPVAGSIYECPFHFVAGTTTPALKEGAPE